MEVDLIQVALERLSLALDQHARLGTVHVEHQERIVFDYASPNGRGVVKVDMSTRRHRREHAVLTAAALDGLAVPRILHADPSPPALLVLEYLAGTSLKAAGPPAWEEAGKALRRIHELDPPPEVEEIGSLGRSWSQHFRGWADHEKDQLLDRPLLPLFTVTHLHEVPAAAFDAAEDPELAVLHGDCQPDHYLVGKGWISSWVPTS